MALTQFAVLIAAKRVNLAILGEDGCVVSSASDLQDWDVPRALLRFRIELLLPLESQLPAHVQAPYVHLRI